MASKFWVGKAAAVSQVTTVAVGGAPAGETFTISVNGVTIASASVSGGTPDAIAAALISAWNLSSHVYRTGVTAAAGGTGEVLLTGTAGAPFTVDLNTPGGSATFAQAETTPATGPNHWDNAANWSDGAIPADGDDVTLRSSSVHVAWGLDQSAVELNSLTIEQTYTGRVGLSRNAFATSADGQTVSAAATEYREDYLRIGFEDLRIGDLPGPGAPNGSQRLKIDCTKSGGAPRAKILNTASSSAEAGLPAVRLLFDNVNAEVHCRNGRGGVGIAIDEPTETATLALVTVSGSSRAFIGRGCTLSSFEMNNGEARLSSASTVSTLKQWGGTLRTEGEFTVSQATIYGGTAYLNHTKASGDAITVLNVQGGEVDFTGSLDDRTVGTLNPSIGSRIRFNADHLTVLQFSSPAAGLFTVSYEAGA